MIERRATNQNAKIVFFGSSEFSLPSLEAVCALSRSVLVVTHAPTRVGRAQILTPMPVAIRATALAMKTLAVSNLRQSSSHQRIKEFSPELGVCAAFGMIFPTEILRIFPKGIINVHPSLLPRHRGPSPVQWSVRAGDIETGVTLFVIDDQIDHGPVIAQERLTIPLGTLTPQLMESLATLGGDLVARTLPHYLKGEIKPHPQDDSAASMTPMLTRDSGKIDWARDDAAQIERSLRAFTPWPGVWTLFKGRRLKILKTSIVIPSQNESSRPPDLPLAPATVFVHNNHLAFQTIKGFLRPSMIQSEGGNPMSAEEFLRGHSQMVGAKLGR